MNNPPGKLCPRCQTLTGLAAPSCLACGHVFRTRFAPPDPAPPTQMYTGENAQGFVAPPHPQPKPNRLPLYTIFLLIGAAFIGGVVLLAVIGSLLPAPPPPGPQTLALEQKMKPYELTSAIGFMNRFGVDDNSIDQTLSGVSYKVWFYNTKDGTVQVWVNLRLGIVERIGSTGKT